MYDYAGAVHIHSDNSYDGTTSVTEIVDSARRSGLDFIVITDHFRLDARKDGWGGWHDGVMVLVEEEISPRYNHYLALNLKSPVVEWKKESKPQSYIDEVNRQGGFGLITHPDHTGALKFGVKEYPWKDWTVSGYTGISVWDFMTDWLEKLKSPLCALLAYFFPAWSLTGAKSETLKRWDDLNKHRKVLGYGEVDNHNSKKIFFKIAFKIFPFDYSFSTIRTHILLNEPLSTHGGTAKEQIYGALRSCSAYIAQERWCNSAGFEFQVYDKNKSANVGDDFMLGTDEAAVKVRLPEKCDGLIKLILNGKVIEKGKKFLEVRVQKSGVYRVEVGQKVFGFYKPWIYSNPIWIH